LKQLSKNDVEKINTEIKNAYGKEDFFDKKDQLVIKDFEHALFILKDKQPMFFYKEGKPIPTLKSLLTNQFLKTATVDMGAVKFVSSGADVMRPGIKELDHTINKGDIIAIVDEKHKKPLCVAEALFSGEEIFQMKTGRVFKNVHHVGDVIWKIDS